MMTPQIARFLLKYAVVLLIAILLLGVYVQSCMNTPLNNVTTDQYYDLVRGERISQTAKNLHALGVLEHPDVFMYVAYFTGQASKIQAGEYQLTQGLTARMLLSKFAHGEVVKRQVTFIEGWTFSQMLNALAKHEKIEHTLNGLHPQEIMKKLGVEGEFYEGRFFPDSYRYQKGMTDIEVLQQAYKQMQTVLDEEWQQRDMNVPYKTPYEALIMASIVEKETGAKAEQPRIAGVFVRRLQKGMLLQTDPSVIYGLSNKYAGNLTRKHLVIDTPYNTYVRVGLPPTPIASPGRGAIHAALHPVDEKALYFVGKGDGSHYFSETLAEHNQAVRQYQLHRDNNYRSSPAP